MIFFTFFFKNSTIWQYLIKNTLPSHEKIATLLNLRVCLFGGEIGWMENFGEKMGRKTFLSMFGWVGRKENKW